MKVQLLKPLVITIPAGTILSTVGDDKLTAESIAAFQPISINLPDGTRVVERGFYEPHYLTAAGVVLIEDRRYDIETVVSNGQRRGETKVMRDWVYRGFIDSRWSTPRALFVKYASYGRRYGSRRELEVAEIKGVVEVGTAD